MENYDISTQQKHYHDQSQQCYNYFKKYDQIRRKYPPLEHKEIEINYKLKKLSWKQQFADLPAVKAFNSIRHVQTNEQMEEDEEIMEAQSDENDLTKPQLEQDSDDMKMQISPQMPTKRLTHKDKVLALDKKIRETKDEYTHFQPKDPIQITKTNKKTVQRSKSSPPQMKKRKGQPPIGNRPIPSKHPLMTNSPKKRPKQSIFNAPLSLSPSPDSSSQDSFIFGHTFTHAQPQDSDTEMTPVNQQNYQRHPQAPIHGPITPEHLIIKPRKSFKKLNLENCTQTSSPIFPPLELEKNNTQTHSDYEKGITSQSSSSITPVNSTLLGRTLLGQNPKGIKKTPA